jgi:hypothetical protein
VIGFREKRVLSFFSGIPSVKVMTAMLSHPEEGREFRDQQAKPKYRPRVQETPCLSIATSTTIKPAMISRAETLASTPTSQPMKIVTAASEEL